MRQNGEWARGGRLLKEISILEDCKLDAGMPPPALPPSLKLQRMLKLRTVYAKHAKKRE